VNPYSGDLYIADMYNQRIRMVTASTGIVTTVAGNWAYGYNGDNIVAISAQLNYPAGVATVGSGIFLIADYLNNRIRKVLSNEHVTP
jgi:hypothetical protein